MANYSQTVFFGPKDALTTGDPSKVIKGTEMDGELSAISTAIASKENSANKGAANGYASLDASVFVPTAQLPVVPVTKGGTGVATVAAGNLLLGAGTSAMTSLAPSTTRRVAISNGTTWTSRLLEAADIPSLDASKITTGAFDAARIPSLDASKITTGTLAVARGGTNIGSYTTGNYIRASGATTLEQRTPAQVRSDIGAGTGTVTSVGNGNGMNFTTFTTSGTVTLGTPSTLTKSSTNAVTTSSHTHAIGDGIVKAHTTTGGQITVSTSAPSGGTNGDIWLVV